MKVDYFFNHIYEQIRFLSHIILTEYYYCRILLLFIIIIVITIMIFVVGGYSSRGAGRSKRRKLWARMRSQTVRRCGMPASSGAIYLPMPSRGTAPLSCTGRLYTVGPATGESQQQRRYLREI